MTFHEWYRAEIMPNVYGEQAAYERESVAYRALEKLTREEIIRFYQSMTDAELRLSLFDHLKNCMEENWDPYATDDFPDNA